MNKILLCLGARPESIKRPTLVYEYRKSAISEVKLCVTEQHI
jgi:UDP-N-acetylglucosamine 2-epimerase